MDSDLIFLMFLSNCYDPRDSEKNQSLGTFVWHIIHFIVKNSYTMYHQCTINLRRILGIT